MVSFQVSQSNTSQETISLSLDAGSLAGNASEPCHHDTHAMGLASCRGLAKLEAVVTWRKAVGRGRTAMSIEFDEGVA